MILGKTWLTRNNPGVNWVTNTLWLAKGAAVYKLVGESLDAKPKVENLSAKQLCTMLRKKSQVQDVFMALVTEKKEGEEEKKEARKSEPVMPIDPEFRQKVEELLKKYPDLGKDPGYPPDRGRHNFKVTLEPGATPKSRQTGRMSPLELEEVRKQLQGMLEGGLVRPSKSPYGAPILFARKKDGGLHMCIDYRALNKQTVKDRYPLPRIDELLDQLNGAKVFTKVDLASGYHQVRMVEEDIQKTAFCTRYGQYEFTVMPFGMSNAPSQFMRMMNEYMAPYLDKFVIVFIDDILIYSKNKEEHLEHVAKVLDALKEQKLKVRPHKCSYGQKEVNFLGFVVSDEGIKVDPKKVAAVAEWPHPISAQEVRSFLGLAGYYRRFIQGFSGIARPLTDLTKKYARWTWGQPQVEAFEKLKAALVSAPVLLTPDESLPFELRAWRENGSYPDLNLPFELYTDASSFAIGAVLMQDQGNGLQPVAFESKNLTPAEQNYPVHEQELLAVIHALKTWRCYLEGVEFKVNTDHQTLQYLKQQPDLSRR